MNDMLAVGLAFIAGLCFGIFFFGGLWWTVQRAVNSTHPAVWFLVSQILRFSIVLAGFYLVGAGQWQRILACGFGFFVSKWTISYLNRNKSLLLLEQVRAQTRIQPQIVKGESHASQSR